MSTFFKLKALRVEHDMTQEDLAKRLNIHEVTYNRKEKGTTDFTLTEARTLSNLFKMTIEQIFFKNNFS